MTSGQFNVPLTERYSVALRSLALRDDRSIPDLLRPVIEAYLDEVLQADSDLEKAVGAVLRARKRQRPTSTVTPMRTSRSKARPT
jgi:hypothetical protein